MQKLIGRRPPNSSTCTNYPCLGVFRSAPYASQFRSRSEECWSWPRWTRAEAAVAPVAPWTHFLFPIAGLRSPIDRSGLTTTHTGWKRRIFSKRRPLKTWTWKSRSKLLSGQLFPKKCNRNVLYLYSILQHTFRYQTLQDFDSFEIELVQALICFTEVRFSTAELFICCSLKHS